MGDWLYNGLIDWLADRVLGMLGGLVSILGTGFFTTPDVTTYPQVQHLAGRSSMVVNATLGLAIVVAAAIGMTHGSVQIQYELKDLIPRLVFAVVISNFGVPLCQVLIHTANALTTAMMGPTASGPQVVTFVKDSVVAALIDGVSAALAVVIGLIIVVQFYLLAVAWLTRVAVLIILAGIAPAALACYCLPHTQPAVQLWWRTVLGCLATPLLQAIFFSTAVDLLLEPEHNLPALLGVGIGPSAATFNLFVAATVLWMTVRIPSMIGRYVTRTGQKSTASVVLKAVIIQTVTRKLRLPRAGR